MSIVFIKSDVDSLLLDLLHRSGFIPIQESNSRSYKEGDLRLVCVHVDPIFPGKTLRIRILRAVKLSQDPKASIDWMIVYDYALPPPYEECCVMKTRPLPERILLDPLSMERARQLSMTTEPTIETMSRE
jgi:hypothetical protein